MCVPLTKAADVAAISTGSLGLDIALGIGGLPRGRVVEIYGPESSGKTTLALHVIASALLLSRTLRVALTAKTGGERRGTKTRGEMHLYRC